LIKIISTIQQSISEVEILAHLKLISLIGAEQMASVLKSDKFYSICMIMEDTLSTQRWLNGILELDDLWSLVIPTFFCGKSIL